MGDSETAKEVKGGSCIEVYYLQTTSKSGVKNEKHKTWVAVNCFAVCVVNRRLKAVAVC